jgi:type 1 glutamine amidotransferase/cytochrome c551/c552
MGQRFIRSWRTIVGAGLFGWLLLGLAMPSANGAERTRQIVLIAGPADGHPHGTHEYAATVRLLGACLQTAANVQVANPSGIGVKVCEAWPEGDGTLEAADTIVLVTSGSDKVEANHPLLVGEHLKQIETQVKRGCGLVAIHYSTFAPNRVGPKMLEWLGGYFDYQSGPASNGWFSKIQHWDVDAKPVALDHPICRGVQPIRVTEEFYYNIRFRPDDQRLTPILTTRPPGEDRDYAVAWAVERPDGGRGFGFTGGHHFENWSKPDFRRLVLNAILWTAGANVPSEGTKSQLSSAESNQAPIATRPFSKPGGKLKSHGSFDEKDGIDDRWQQTDVGRFFSGSLRSAGGSTGKGLAVRIGEQQEAAVMYDTERLRLVCGWQGKFMRFDPARFGLINMPGVAGEEQFANPALPGWGPAEVLEKPDPNLPSPDGVHYRGLYLHGGRVVLSLLAAGAEVLESPWIETRDSLSAFTRSLEVGPHAQPLETLVVDVPAAEGHLDEMSDDIAWLRSGAHSTGVGLVGEGACLAIGEHRRVVLRIAASDVVQRFKLYITKVAASDEVSLAQWIAGSKPPEDLQALTAPTAPHWSETVVTQGVRSREPGPYVVDTLTLPTENPYRALMFTSGHDFFSSGDAAICTAHGEVWVASGIDDSLSELRWRRFATGLYQPLGLRIIDDVVYVVGRDQITRLVDRNGDGEADWYENFNNDSSTGGGHDFSTCLETDRAGNFYFLHAKDGLVQISPDGRQRRVIASGFRNPNGMGIDPDDTITVAPQEGEWVGASSIVQVKPGGYYGFPGPRVTPARTLGCDPPWCWIPRALDNSSGGQVWAAGDRFGPLTGHLVHLSYGRSWPLLALEDKVGEVRQGAITPLPVRFESGAMRGRMRPQDGQLYVTGLRGWENNAVRDGCFERMRYTGAAAHLPVGIRYHEDGVAVTFSCALDKASAEDVDNYSIEVWNYAYHQTYGSPDFKVSSPGIEGRDELDVRAATLEADGRTVSLSVDRLSPVMQIGLDFTLDAADGVPINSGVYGTIHALHPRLQDPAVLARAVSPRNALAPDIESRLQPGLIFRFRGTDTQPKPGGRDSDVCLRRLAALYVGRGQAPTPWLPAGPFSVAAEGFLKLPLRGSYRFHFTGGGHAELWINGQQVVEGTAEDLSTVESPLLRLRKGYNALRIAYAPAADAPASFQLHWSGENFAAEPIPPTVLFCDGGAPGFAEASLLRRGRELFAGHMCSRCHVTPSEQQPANQSAGIEAVPMPELSKEGPALDYLGTRLRADWIAAWIADPRRVEPKATMPRLFTADSAVDRQEIADLVAYLHAHKAEPSTLATPPVADEAVIDAGEIHFERLGCIACHTLAPSKEPDEHGRRTLSLVSVKFAPGALEEFLRKPHARYAWSRMPDFNLSQQEVAELAAFLQARTAGKLEVDPLATGDPARGQIAFGERGCRQCHNDPLVPPRPLPINGLFAKSGHRLGCLAATSSERGRAPDFELEQDDRLALAALLAGDGKSLLVDTPVEASTRLVKSFGCAACHAIDARPAQFPKIFTDESVTGLPPDHFPSLTFAGEKLKAEWMRAFFAGQLEDRPRPWLAARMPAFPVAATALAEGLAAEHGVGPHEQRSTPDAALAEIGLQLTQPRGGLDCRQCHGLERLTARQPNDGQGISFLHVAQRIRRPYYRRWMLDPLRIDPGTKMPRLSPDGQRTAVKHILDGSADRQFEALWNYLESVGQPLP